MKSFCTFFFLPFIFFSGVLSESSLSEVLFADELNYTSITMGISEFWLLSNGNKQLYNLGGNIIIGQFGFGETVTRRFFDLPSHKEIRISFNLFQAEFWDSEYFNIRNNTLGSVGVVLEKALWI